MNFFHLEELTQREIIPGAWARFVHSESMTVAYWNINEGTLFPDHSHPHEQVFILLEGTFELTVNGKTEVFDSNSVVLIPSNESHSGRAITECKTIDIFHPVREDYTE
jgi:quercetin dioxygenase-like cupin family protein